MCDTVGIKIPVGNSVAKCASVIRKIDPSLSISEINNRINNNKYVLSFDYIDYEGVKKIIKCYEELNKLGVVAKLYELDDEECTLDDLKNLDDMYDEIGEEIENELE